VQLFPHSSPRAKPALLFLSLLIPTIGLLTAVVSRADLPGGAVTQEQVVRGRLVMVTRACGGCHSRGNDSNPGQDKWLAGALVDSDFFQIGPFKTRAANLTPDNTTGLGQISERQIFNALRYGLDPGQTPDVVITSATPGQGNFPGTPKYLAPPMPWPSWRHMPDQDLWDIAAYLKHGIQAVSNKVKDSEGPPDFWASAYTPDKIGTYPLAVYPSGSEVFTP
jgi:mono/diheme cytochrome c family protein